MWLRACQTVFTGSVPAQLPPQFDGQYQKSCYDLFGLKYEYMPVTKEGDRYELIPYDESQAMEMIREVKPLVNLYEGPLNNIGTSPRKNANPLSYTWYKNHRGRDMTVLQRNIYNFFNNVAKGKSRDNLWCAAGQIFEIRDNKLRRRSKRPAPPIQK